MCCPQPPSMWSYPRTHRAAHLRPLRACLQHDVAGMPLHRELDGGGAEDGLGALPGLRAQVPEVQMFAEGACYFQAAQAAPPPRYDVKPQEVCEVERPAYSLDADFRAGVAEVQARIAHEQQLQHQWLHAAQAASQQAVQSAPAAGRDVVPHVLRGSYMPLQHPTPLHQFMPQQKPSPPRIAKASGAIHPGFLPVRVRQRSSIALTPLLPGQQVQQLASHPSPDVPSQQVEQALAAMRSSPGVWAPCSTPRPRCGTSVGPAEDPPFGCSGVAQQAGRALFSPICAQAQTPTAAACAHPPTPSTAASAASFSSPRAQTTTHVPAAPQLPKEQPAGPSPSLASAECCRILKRVFQVWLLVDESDMSRGQPVALPPLQEKDPRFGVLGRLTVSSGANPPDTATAHWDSTSPSEGGPPEDQANAIYITPATVADSFCSLSFSVDQPMMNVVRSVAHTGLAGEAFEDCDRQVVEDFMFKVPAEQKVACAMLLGSEAPSLVAATSNPGTDPPRHLYDSPQPHYCLRDHPVTGLTPVTALDTTSAFSATAAFAAFAAFSFAGFAAFSSSVAESGQSAPYRRLTYTRAPSPPGDVAAYDARSEVIRYMQTTPLDSAAASSGAPPPGSDPLPPGAGETFDSQPPSPSYSPTPSPGPGPSPEPEPEDQAPPQSGGHGGHEGTASQSPASQSPAQHEVDNEVDNQELAIRRAIRLAVMAEEHLQELFPASVPTFDAIFEWTEFFLLGDYAYKDVDEHALNRILDHFLQLAHGGPADRPQS